LQEVLLSKITQFPQENNELGAVASNIGGFFWRDTCVSTAQVNRPVWSKHTYLLLETPKLREEFILKIKSIVTGKQCGRCSCL
jgi:hypothetical protein